MGQLDQILLTMLYRSAHCLCMANGFSEFPAHPLHVSPTQTIVIGLGNIPFFKIMDL
jgi:hypothetical protein